MSEVSPLIVTHGEKEIPVSTDPKVMQFVTEFFKKNSPDLSQYFYKDWTDYEYEKVAEYVKAIVPYKQIIDNLISTTRDERMKKHFTNSKPISRTSAPAGEALEFSPAPQSKSSSLSLEDDDLLGAAPSKQAVKKQDDLDDLFADL